MTAPVVFEKVTKKFGSETIVDQLDWSLPASGTICLFGPSGAARPQSCISWQESYTGWRSDHRPCGTYRFSCVSRTPMLPWMSALHNITATMHTPRDAGERREEIACHWLTRLGLSGAADKLPDELSGGMRQRVAIARALAYGGDLLLLDEPTQGLDVAMRDTVLDLLRETGKDRLTVLVTHDPEAAERMGSTVIPVYGPPVRRMV